MPAAKSRVIATAEAGLLTNPTALPLFRPPYGKSDGITTAQVPHAVPSMGQRAPFRAKNALVGVVKTSDLAERPRASGNNVDFAS